jgi:anhydro-N-acetylmuramic acid kinase
LPASPDTRVTGFDTGPGNALLDAWIQQHQSIAFDADGKWASSGTVNKQLLECFLSDDYFKLSPPKSTGKDDFDLDWIQYNLKKTGADISPQDIQATLLALTIETITNAIETYAAQTTEILVCGGGIHNNALINGLKAQNKHRIINSTEVYGIDPDAVEAVTFAWLAHLRITGKPGNLPSVSGANEAVLLGGLYQGR